MPKSRTSRRSSSSSSRKKMTTSRKQPKGVPMPPHHIMRIIDGEKSMYSRMGMAFSQEDDVKMILTHLKFKKPSDPYSFWGNIYTWHDAVRKALPIKN